VKDGRAAGWRGKRIEMLLPCSLSILNRIRQEALQRPRNPATAVRKAPTTDLLTDIIEAAVLNYGLFAST